MRRMWGQMVAALRAGREEGPLLTAWFDVKQGHSSSSAGRPPITSRLHLQLQPPPIPNYILNLHSNGPGYATFPSALMCIWLSISL